MCVERREQTRIFYQVDASIAYDENWQQAQCNNLSMSGMLLVTNAPISVGGRGKVKIDQEYADELICIHADIEVVRVEEIEGKEGLYEVGVKFTNLEPGASIDLLNLVRFHSGEGGACCKNCECSKQEGA